MELPATIKWTCLLRTTRKRLISVTAIGADIEVLAMKGSPSEEDYGYWICDGETKDVPLVKYEQLYARGRKSHTSQPKITLDE